MFTWYWLADLCEDEGIPFVLGRAIYFMLQRNQAFDMNKFVSFVR